MSSVSGYNPQQPLFFSLMAPTTDIKIAAEGAGGTDHCFVGFTLLAREAADRMTVHKNALIETYMANLRTNPETKPDELDQLLIEHIQYVREFPLVQQDKKGKLRVVARIDTRDVKQQFRAPFQPLVDLWTKEQNDTGADGESPEIVFNWEAPEQVLDMMLRYVILRSAPWQAGFNAAFASSLTNLPQSKMARVGNF